MSDIYQQTKEAVKRIKKIQAIIQQGLGKPEEYREAMEIAKKTTSHFTQDLMKRKVEKENKKHFGHLIQKMDL